MLQKEEPRLRCLLVLLLSLLMLAAASGSSLDSLQVPTLQRVVAPSDEGEFLRGRFSAEQRE